MIEYDSFSRCHLTDIFFAIFAGAKELTLIYPFTNSVCFLIIQFSKSLFIKLLVNYRRRMKLRNLPQIKKCAKTLCLDTLRS